MARASSACACVSSLTWDGCGGRGRGDSGLTDVIVPVVPTAVAAGEAVRGAFHAWF